MNDLVTRYDERDYIKGVNSPVVTKAVLPSGDWTPYFHFNELQKINGFETDCCVIFSAQETTDAMMDYLISSGQISKELLGLFTSMGFMDSASDDGKPHFHSSARYWSALTGNGQNGNALQDPWNVARKYGCIPYTVLPFDASVTPQEYFAKPSQTLLNLGQQFLAAVGGANWITYHWIFNQAGGTITFSAIDSERKETPLCIGVAVTDGWNADEPTPPPLGNPAGHSVTNFSRVPDGEEILDHYIPFQKLLVNGYPIPQVMQAVLTITPPPPAPLPPAPTIPANPTPAQAATWSTWLTKLATWLGLIKSGLSAIPENQKVASDEFYTNFMSYDFIKSRTFWTTVVVIGYNFFTTLVPMFPQVPWITTVVDVLGFVAVNIFHAAGVKNAALASAGGTPNLGQ